MWHQTTGSPCLTHKQKRQQQQQHRVAIPTSSCLELRSENWISDLSLGAVLATNEPRLNNSAGWRFFLPTTHMPPCKLLWIFASCETKLKFTRFLYSQMHLNIMAIQWILSLKSLWCFQVLHPFLMHVIEGGVLNFTVVGTVDQPTAVHRKTTVEKACRWAQSSVSYFKEYALVFACAGYIFA